ncbi:hypothetical protein BDQ12DRAFT_725740 [Crucibulum laeve]|uniref:VWFA domain-containing protein n=1 Tax=Crucibulum laeve TaxID=68775 RepID=A0A5C3M3N3_9AGAR|nr:hypothetical protein BDQ12DRAFT_725740 [Crucibulum laeve]
MGAIKSSSAPTASRPIKDSQEPLRRSNVVLVVDDSSKMEEKWKKVEATIEALAPMVAKYYRAGLETHFLNYRFVDRSQKREDVVDLFKIVRPSGQVQIGKKLRGLLSVYLDDMKNGNSAQPVQYMVIVNGRPTDKQNENKLGSVLEHVAVRLDTFRVPPSQIQIQFIYVGDDPSAAEYYESLASNLETCRNRKMIHVSLQPGASLNLVQYLDRDDNPDI